MVVLGFLDWLPLDFWTGCLLFLLLLLVVCVLVLFVWCCFLGCFSGLLKVSFIYVVYKTLSKLLFCVCAGVGCCCLCLLFSVAVGFVLGGLDWLLVYLGWLLVLVSFNCCGFVGGFSVFIVFVCGCWLPVRGKGFFCFY